MDPRQSGRMQPRPLDLIVDRSRNVAVESSAVSPGRPRGRPPKLIPAYGETREALVRVGVAFLSERTFSATALEEVLKTAGVPKGSFYHYFTSKTEFGCAVIDAYAHYFATRLDRAFLRPAASPLSRIRDFMDEAAEGMARHGYRRGCVVGNLGQEIGALPDVFRKRLGRVLSDWQRRTALVLAEAQAAGELDTCHNVGSLAAFFWIGWEGAVLRAKLELDPAPIALFADQFMALLRR